MIQPPRWFLENPWRTHRISVDTYFRESSVVVLGIAKKQVERDCAGIEVVVEARARSISE
jgi:hypothetical protein